MDVDMSGTPNYAPGTTRSGRKFRVEAAVGSKSYGMSEDELTAIGNTVDGILSSSSDAMETGGRRGYRKHKGGVGACSDRSRTIIKGLVLTALGISSYFGAPAANAVVGWVGAGLTWLANAKCTIGYPGGIETALCTKYGELLNGMTSIIATISGNAALGSITIVGIGYGAVESAKGAIGKTTEFVSYVASSSNARVDELVDIICTIIYGSEADKQRLKTEKGIQTDAPELVAAAKQASAAIEQIPDDAGQQKITKFLKTKTSAGKGGRKHRSSKRTMKKKRVAKKSTRKMSFRY